MDEPFNPYVEWLGLTESTVKPDHYRLLGLPPFESDISRITSACNGMLAKVRSNRPGPHLREWQALLDELTAARNCLLDGQAREKYDTHLRTGDEPVATAAPASSPSSNPTGGASYMWPPGFVPPAGKTSPASLASAPAATSRPAEQATSASLLPPSGQSAMPTPASAVPFTPPSPTAAPAAYTVPTNIAPSTYAAPGPAANAGPGSVPVLSPGVLSAPATPYANPYPHSGMPLASPVPAPAGSHVLPASPYGSQGFDPMAPVVGPIGSAGSIPLAQPIAGYGQGAPTAYAAGGYGQGYVQPQGQPAGMNYGAPVAQALPIGGMSAQATPVSAMPIGGMPIATSVGMNAGHGMPMRAAMPVQSIPTAAAEPELGLKVPGSSTSKAYKQARKKNSISTAIAALLAASLLVIAAFFVALKDGNLLALKPDVPRSASEMPIPTNVPPPVEANGAPPINEILSPLKEESSPAKPKLKKPKIGPLVEDGQTPETMPLIDPETNKTNSPESAIPPTMKPEETPKPEDTAPVSTASPQETAAVRKALGQAIVAMGFRDRDTAKDKLAEARTAATDELLKEKVEAVESLSTGVEEYWRAVRESTKSLGAGQELVIGSTRVAVVEASDKLLILRVGGMNKRYPIDDLPMGLARTLASTWFDNNAASTKVFTGCFLFVEPNGDPAEVRQLWQAAKQEGVNVDLLMPLLEDDLKAEGRSEPEKS